MSKNKIEPVSKDFWENEICSENRDLIEEFLLDGTFSDDTKKQYRSALQIFARWVHENVEIKPTEHQPIRYKKGEAPIGLLQPRHGRQYQNWLVSLGLSSNSIKTKRFAVSSFCNFLINDYGDDYPRFKNIFNKGIKSPPKVNKKEKNPLSKEEFEKIKKELKKSQDWRKLAFLNFCYVTGCRREEARQLRMEILNYKPIVKESKDGAKFSYYLTHSIRAKGAGKEGKVRKFKFDEETMGYIRLWAEERALQVEGQDECPFVFATKRNGVFQQASKNTLNYWCSTFEKFIGRKIHPHLIRSTRATIAKEEGFDIKAIQALLGHNSSETTEIYIVSDDEDDDDALFL